MQAEGNPLVFVLLGAAFAAVGVHLFFWSRRQSRKLKAFARSRGLPYQARDDGRLEADLNAAMALDEPGLARTFGRVRDVIALEDGATLFRATELLDLNPWGEAETSHHARTAVFFDAPDAPSGIFSIRPDREVRQRHPRDGADSEAVRALLERLGVPRPPCALSLTFMRGKGVGYLEPTVVGQLADEHLRYLAGLVGVFREAGKTGAQSEGGEGG